MQVDSDKKDGRGGRRKGAGRPFKDDEKRMYIRLNALQKRIL